MTSYAIQPQDVSVDDLTITALDGQTTNIKNIMLELSYFEDIFSFSVSGYVTVRDSNGLIEALKLTGHEDISINFGKVTGGANNVKVKLKIYKIANRVPELNTTSEIYTLYFCSEDLLISEQIKVTKPYNNMIISDMVSDILTNELGAPKIYDIEETTGLYNFVVNRLKPFEAVSWLSTYALPASSGTDAADMLLFDTKNGLVFASIATLMSFSPYQTYKFQPKNLDTDFDNKVNSVLKYEVINNVDNLKQISSGGFANKVWTIDPFTRTWNVTTYDYLKDSNVDGKSAMTPIPNRMGKTLNQMVDSSFKVLIGNKEQKMAPGIGEDTTDEQSSPEKIDSVANDIRAEKYVPKRSAQMSLVNHIVVKLVIPGDPGITAGRTINFNLPSRTDSSQLDSYYSGKYLVTAVRHIVQSQGVYQTILEIAKETFPK